MIQESLSFEKAFERLEQIEQLLKNKGELALDTNQNPQTESFKQSQLFNV
jgi:exonuclease VII small subunit